MKYFYSFFLHPSKSFRNSPCHFTSRNLILSLSTVKKTNGPLSHFIFCVHCFPFFAVFVYFLSPLFLPPAVAFPFFIFYSHTALFPLSLRAHFCKTRVNFVEGMSAKGQETRDSPFIHPILLFLSFLRFFGLSAAHCTLSFFYVISLLFDICLAIT